MLVFFSMEFNQNLVYTWTLVGTFESRFILTVSQCLRNIYIILCEDFLENPPFQGKNIFKEIFLRSCVKCFGKFYEEGLAPVLLDDGFWLCRLLVENPFEDYYVGLHLQNDLCYDYCWDCFEMMVWKDWVERLLWSFCWMKFWKDWVESLFWIFCWMMFWNDGFMRLFWNDESVGGECRVMMMMGRWARPTLTI